MDNAILKTEYATRDAVEWVVSNWGLLPNPDLVLKKQGKRIEAYHELLYDPHLSACIQSRKAGTMSLEWRLAIPDGTEKQAELVQTFLDETSLMDVINSILDAPLYGYQVLEVVWDNIAGKLLPVSIEGKSPQWFAYNETGELVLRTKDSYSGKVLPDYKFLVPRYNTSYANPYGQSVLARCYWAAYFKKNAQRFWNNYIDKFGSPYIFATHEYGSDQTKTNALVDSLSALAQEGIAAIPKGTEVRLETDGSTARSDIYLEFLSFMNAEISKAVLGQTLSTEIQKGGSYAAAKAHLDVRSEIVESDRRLVEQTMNKLIRWVYELNMITVTPPKFVMYEESDPKKLLAERDEILTRLGVKFDKSYLIEQYGLKETDFEIGQPTAATALAQFAEEPPISGDDAQKYVDSMIDGISDAEMTFQIQKLIKECSNGIRNAANFAELTDSLADMYPRMDTRKLETMLESRLIVANSLGYASAESTE